MPSSDTQPDPAVARATTAGLRVGPVANPAGRRDQVRAFLASYWTPAGKQALRNLSGLVLCTGVSQACALGVLLILTDGLSQAAFGAVIFALNLQTYLITLGMIGLATIVVRDLTQQPERADETTTAYTVLVGAASLLTGLVTALVAALVAVSWDERVMLWCLAAGNVFACLNLGPLYDAAHRQSLSAALMLPADVGSLGAIAALSATGALTVPAVGFILLGKWALTAGLHAAVFGRTVRPFRRTWNRDRARQLMRAGRPMMWAGLLYSVPMSGGVVLVRVLGTGADAAVYGLTFQIVAVQLTLVALILRVLQPHINGPHGLTRRFVGQLVMFGLVALGALCAAALVAGWVLVDSFVAPEYRPVYPLLAIFQVFVACHAVAAGINSYLIRAHKERWATAVCVLSALTFLGFLFLGDRDRPRGCAVATVLSSVVLVIGCGAGLGVGKPAVRPILKVTP